MKKVIIYSGKSEPNPFIKLYVLFFSFLIRFLTFTFKTIGLPGLSRLLGLFSKMPSKNFLLKVRFNDGGEFSFPVFDYYYNMFFLMDRDYENEVLSLINGFNEKFIFFDGGANMGYISSSVSYLSKYCQHIVSIEPNSSLHRYLSYNLVKSTDNHTRSSASTFTILGDAIGGNTTEVQSFFFERHAGSGLAEFGHKSKAEVKVKVTSLDSLVEEYGKSGVKNIIKLDLEGAELAAIENFNHFENSILIFEVLNLKNSLNMIQELSKKNKLSVYYFRDNWKLLDFNYFRGQSNKKYLTDFGFNILLMPDKLSQHYFTFKN